MIDSKKGTGGKIVALNNLPSICSKLRSQGKTIVTTNGAFDILHVGHVKYLESAKALGDILIVGINSDKSVRKLKGKGRPINSEKSRAIVIASLQCVDYVCIFDHHLPLEFISKAIPKVHVKGGDYLKKNLPETPLVKSIGGSIKIIKFEKGFSTTNVLKKIRKG
ncbi:D-glycero-beta-D-manno-heptose 1-phosphate adenylyltransferase [Candidatus Micrarchaeota archaeon]|nr:D-glycero-beta-D-manno-heptose 1-phosphate adenylyltransferase [Candidatus Micrarchaeota archaeon]